MRNGVLYQDPNENPQTLPEEFMVRNASLISKKRHGCIGDGEINSVLLTIDNAFLTRTRDPEIGAKSVDNCTATAGEKSRHRFFSNRWITMLATAVRER